MVGGLGPQTVAGCAGQPRGNAPAAQEATHCQRPVPEPGSTSPRRCTLSLCVDRQQSHSVPEKKAYVSCPPAPSTWMDIRTAHSPAIPASSPQTAAAFTSAGTRRPRQCDPEPPPGPGTAGAWLPPFHPPNTSAPEQMLRPRPPQLLCGSPVVLEAGLHSSPSGKSAVGPALFEIVTLCLMLQV